MLFLVSIRIGNNKTLFLWGIDGKIFLFSKNLRIFFLLNVVSKFAKYSLFINFSLLIVFFSTTYSNANAFKVSDVEISSPFVLNFEKNSVIDKGFQTSFSDLISMITTSGDRKKIKNVSIKELKGMIDSFTISDEKFINNEYFANLETTFNKKKILMIY